MFDLNYLNQLIAYAIEENHELEYKAAPSLSKEDRKVTEITKDVTSFANSNGGIIIYGLTENKAERNKPGEIDPVNRKLLTKEWLEQILNSRIRPRIHGLKIHVISVNGDSDQVVFILEIPKGETAHQADDKKYYRRHNFMAEPMYDHEIRDIMNRQKGPQIVLTFDISKTINYKKSADFEAKRDDKQPYLYQLNIYAGNIGKVYAKYVNLILTIPQRCTSIENYDKFNDQTVEVKADNKVRDEVSPDADRYYPGPIAKPKQFGPARYEPILPGLRMLLKSIPVHEFARDFGNEMSWTIYADNAEPNTDSVDMSEIEILYP
ncbi:AlbA family DNA-binding domain-containing protein [Mucilaginibacter sp. P25]|uniref:AlbA family DNA-binding domain-containing protein n=1 Tax=Mucilaginibacter sp. P25 TaxID=3423945 RepID=UPI003D7B4800